MQIVNDEKKQLQIILALGCAALATAPFSGLIAKKLGITNEEFIWLKNEIKYNKSFMNDLGRKLMKGDDF